MAYYLYLAVIVVLAVGAAIVVIDGIMAYGEGALIWKFTGTAGGFVTWYPPNCMFLCSTLPITMVKTTQSWESNHFDVVRLFQH
jgi:hypothetical protein